MLLQIYNSLFSKKRKYCYSLFYLQTSISHTTVCIYMGVIDSVGTKFFHSISLIFNILFPLHQLSLTEGEKEKKKRNNVA